MKSLEAFPTGVPYRPSLPLALGVAGVAGGARPAIPRHILVLVVHFGLVVLMATETGKGLRLREVGMAVRAGKPLVFPRVDREGRVIEGRPLPTRFIVTGFAGRRKTRRLVARIRRVVVIVDMTGGAIGGCPLVYPVLMAFAAIQPLV